MEIGNIKDGSPIALFERGADGEFRTTGQDFGAQTEVRNFYHTAKGDLFPEEALTTTQTKGFQIGLCGGLYSMAAAAGNAWVCCFHTCSAIPLPKWGSVKKIEVPVKAIVGLGIAAVPFFMSNYPVAQTCAKIVSRALATSLAAEYFLPTATKPGDLARNYFRDIPKALQYGASMVKAGWESRSNPQRALCAFHRASEAFNTDLKGKKLERRTWSEMDQMQVAERRRAFVVEGLGFNLHKYFGIERYANISAMVGAKPRFAFAEK